MNIPKYNRLLVASEKKCKALEQQNRELRAALEGVEWSNLEWGGNIVICPWCGNGKIRGHHVDCQRQQALVGE